MRLEFIVYIPASTEFDIIFFMRTMNKKFSYFYLFCLIIIIFSLTACSTSPKITVEAKFLGEEIRTTTDSNLVKYYLESYLQGKNNAPDLHNKIDKLYAQYNDA